MPITFGAVGDIISVCLLVKDLVDALDEARGSKAEYQSVIRELWILDRALLEIDLLSRTHGNGATPELRSLCETEAVERFRVKIAGTSASLQMLLATASVNLLALSKDVKEQLSQLVQSSGQRATSQQALLLDVRGRIDNATQQITHGNTALDKVSDALRLD
ncbi:hypothetical protein BU23DRAFT_460501 [Bimuria novae-zelandiae CBS 107.79]|uniref:Fungal N-terminal domain-containing protein n=1 Tax=Bimuria novae-zelandiae CBS 107.79 TaxID=1447943 RepID=A0A6A5VDJ3_9PLEO|nr:hypothetical protein BU23DRAFT_460501 [Bimuria novae-zelandiae CBS 107.79]